MEKKRIPLCIMPDESCRKCGTKLRDYLKCNECNFLFQEICISCNNKTLPRFHNCKLNSIVV